jgi:hypothetical protein
VAFALPWLIWLAANRRGRALAALACGYLPIFGLLGIAWVIGHANAPMAGISMGDAPASTLAGRALASIDAIASFLRFPDADILLARTGGFVKLWLWASPLLLLLAFLGFWRTEQVPIRLLAYSALSTAVAYFAIRFDQGHGWGYRYFHGAWGVLPVLAALGVQRLTDRLGGGKGPAAVVMFVTLSGLVVLGALRSIQVEGFVSAHLLQRPPVQDTRPQVWFTGATDILGGTLCKTIPGYGAGPFPCCNRRGTSRRRLCEPRCREATWSGRTASVAAIRLPIMRGSLDRQAPPVGSRGADGRLKPCRAVASWHTR